MKIHENLYHSTDFNKIQSILKNEIIITQPISLQSQELSDLLKDQKGVWLTPNLFPNNNIFGPYAFQFNYKSITNNLVISLGKNKRYDTFISADKYILNNISEKLKKPIVSDKEWLYKEKVHMIVCADIPINSASNILPIQSSNNRNGKARPASDKNIRIAVSRLLALGLKNKYEILNQIIPESDLNIYASYFLDCLIGLHRSFNKRRSEYDINHTLSAIEIIVEKFLGEPDLQEIRSHTNKMGDIEDIAETISIIFNELLKTNTSKNKILIEYNKYN